MKIDGKEPQNKEFTNYLSACIKVWHEQHPEVTCMQVLYTLEAIRFRLTEAIVRTKTK